MKKFSNKTTKMSLRSLLLALPLMGMMGAAVADTKEEATMAKNPGVFEENGVIYHKVKGMPMSESVEISS